MFYEDASPGAMKRKRPKRPTTYVVNGDKVPANKLHKKMLALVVAAMLVSASLGVGFQRWPQGTSGEMPVQTLIPRQNQVRCPS